MPEGEYTKYGNTVVLKDEGLWVKGEGTNLLSGAVKTLEKDCAYIVSHSGFSLEEALLMASINPARYFGCPSWTELFPGKKGTLMSFTWENDHLKVDRI
jgi:N-acetylglucosamine-6-phosphate deacetylase